MNDWSDADQRERCLREIALRSDVLEERLGTLVSRETEQPPYENPIYQRALGDDACRILNQRHARLSSMASHVGCTAGEMMQAMYDGEMSPRELQVVVARAAFRNSPFYRELPRE